MAIDGIDSVRPLFEEMVKPVQAAHKEAAAQQVAPTGGQPAQAALLQKLAAQYPTLRFAVGDGYGAAQTQALAAQGRGNVMIAPRMLERMVQNPRVADEYSGAFGELADRFDQMFEEAGGLAKSLVAWGSFLSADGLFSTWGVTSPFSNTAPLFEIFDATLARDLVRFEESEYAHLLNEEKEILKYEQELEQAKEGFGHQSTLNPHIISKPQTGAQLRDAFAVGKPQNEDGRLLDEKD